MPCCLQYEGSMTPMSIDHEELIRAMGDAVLVGLYVDPVQAAASEVGI
jgi:hypothetical protein